MADGPKLKEWQCPPASTPLDRKLGWLNESVEEGQAWLKCQRGFGDYRKAFELLSGRPGLDILEYRSHLTTGRFKRNLREVIGAIANIRPIWGYTSDNPQFSAQANMMNKVTRAIYLERFLDQSIKEALQWSAATCTGWLRPVYRRDHYGTGQGALNFLTYGAPSVIPNQLPQDNNFQNAYVVHILDELPIAMAHAMFPDYQDELRPTMSRYWYSSEIRQAARGNLFQRMFGRWGRREGDPLTDLFVPIRYSYVMDLTVNKTGDPIPMGERGTSWSYTVPSEGSDIPYRRDPRTGDTIYRKATVNDARLYPYRRLIISSENAVMYDGPAFDWHGDIPAVGFTLDDWVWEAIGFSIVRDGYEVQRSINELERGVMDKHRAMLDMPLVYDMNSGIGVNDARAFDPMRPRTRLGFDGASGEEPFRPAVPPDVFKVDAQTMPFITHLMDVMDHQLAVKDVIALAKARTLGGGVDDFEKMMEAEGPIVRDISRNVERSLAAVGSQVKYLILQYYTVQRVMQYVGIDGVTPETFDYDPNSLIPSHLPDELPDGYRPPDDFAGGMFPNLSVPTSFHSKNDRARAFADNLRFYLLPHSAHEITQMSHKLGLIQLRKAGVQIDSRTIAEAWDLNNFGTQPEGNTIWERYWNEQEKIAENALRLKAIVDAIQQGGVGPPPDLLAALAQANGGQTQEGRPPSGQAAPQMRQFSSGRSTITESE